VFRLGAADRQDLRARWNAMLSRILGMLFTAYSVQCVINGIAAAGPAARRLRQSVNPLILPSIS
jgi:hypothetical protein